ncbi:GGDEF domain-containing protein [Desulfitobacterium metallireducens]|uniref:Diguanylate cyclase n=1 Tax=Desulfitobacterium metallireducens DSM 15288 TaxID=871968 RepID=W0E690_9FIRM|nr:EAL domain-containing protein [Desulfitobacterium metallireducens]AHF06252.1 diguanylate cyclase [Desulfitobacterium metallireducens DSM 15288]
MNNSAQYNQPHERQLYQILRDGRSIWVLYLDIVKFHEVEFRRGYKTCNRILEEVEKEINHNLKQHAHLFKTTLLECRGGDDFVIYFVPHTQVSFDFQTFITPWLPSLQSKINTRIQEFVLENIHIRTGFVECKPQASRSADYLLYNAVKEAFRLNKSEPDPQYDERKDEIHRLLTHQENHLTSAYQPILDVKRGEIFGFEALARMKAPTCFSNIAELFPFAEKIGELYPIETLCRRSAISSSSKVLKPQELLFLNVNPQILTDPDFASGQTRKLLAQKNLKPSDVVLEITERSAIQDFSTFREALEHYKSQGYLIALDDVGAGYSSLQSIAELQPDFLKIDRSLIQSIHTDPTKWALLETFSTFSRRIGCRLLAEGVETEAEMRTVVQLGVDYVQGYFVAHPSFERAVINPRSLELVKNRHNVNVQDSNTILSLVEPLPLFNPDDSVHVVDEYFRTHPNIWFIGIAEHKRVNGVIHRDKFYSSLGTRYGVSLYMERPITLLMDSNLLMLEDNTPIEIASTLAMSRSDAQLYDGLVVIHQQTAVGMVKVASLIKAMAATQIKIARGANPLTGLPGNIAIEQEIQKRITNRKSFTLIYADFNHFKYYNDSFGFQRGDMVIKLLGEILLRAGGFDHESAFVGHIGGDDFLFITERTQLEELCEAIIAEFKIKTEHMVGANHLSVALAALILPENDALTPAEIAQHAAHLKKETKTIPGNAYRIEPLRIQKNEGTGI